MKSAFNMAKKVNPCGRKINAGKGTWLIIGVVGLGGLVLLMSLKKKGGPVGPPPLPRRYDWTVPVGNITGTLGSSLPKVLGKIPTHWLS